MRALEQQEQQLMRQAATAYFRIPQFLRYQADRANHVGNLDTAWPLPPQPEVAEFLRLCESWARVRRHIAAQRTPNLRLARVRRHRQLP